MDALPPPPYSQKQIYLPRLESLPFDIILRIIQQTGIRSQAWLSTEARLTSRLFYRVIQHHLRSFHLPSYLRLVRPPFSSSPIPHSALSLSTPSSSTMSDPPDYARSSLPSTLSTSSTVFPPSQRNETSVLDLYVATVIHETSMGLQSDGFGEMSDWREDVFIIYQPQARLLDLLLSSPTLLLLELPFPPSDLSLRFTPRKVTLLRLIQGKRRELVRLERTRGESEEITIGRLEAALRDLRGRHWMDGG